MKKVMLSLLLVALCAIGSYANTLQVMNFTYCNYTISTQGGYIYVTPSGTAGANQSYASPNNLANGPSAPVSGTFSAAKVARDGNWAYQLNVGTSGATSAVSSTVGDLPACNSGLAYTVTWNTNTAGNVVMLIF